MSASIAHLEPIQPPGHRDLMREFDRVDDHLAREAICGMPPYDAHMMSDGLPVLGVAGYLASTRFLDVEQGAVRVEYYRTDPLPAWRELTVVAHGELVSRCAYTSTTRLDLLGAEGQAVDMDSSERIYRCNRAALHVLRNTIWCPLSQEMPRAA